MFFALILFRFNITSAKSIGILAGIVFLIAGLFEFAMTAVVRGGWWKALNAILGVLLVVGGILSFIHPSNAFVAVASITGFMFLFVGILDVIVALVRPKGSLVGATDRRDRLHPPRLLGVRRFLAERDATRRLGRCLRPAARDQQLPDRVRASRRAQGADERLRRGLADAVTTGVRAAPVSVFGPGGGAGIGTKA